MTDFVTATTRDLITVAGPDAVAYLQGQLSQDVAKLAVGAAAWSFVLAPQGKVEGWGRVLRAGADEVRVDVDPGAGELWETRLRRFMLRTKAEITVSSDQPMVALRGRDALATLDKADLEAGLVWLPAGWPGVEGRDLFCEPAQAETVIDGLVKAGASRDGGAAVEAMRIRSGVPRWGAELEADTIPASVGQWAIDASVDFAKGCYTGQELVARIDSRGNKVPRRLVGLLSTGPAPAVGADVLVDGSMVSTVTSAVDEAGGSVGLCYLPRSVELTDRGLVADVEGHECRLAELPAYPLPD